jgi:hypothetical protein
MTKLARDLDKKEDIYQLSNLIKTLSEQKIKSKC